MTDYYRLDNRVAIPCDSRAWQAAIQDKDGWRVGDDTVGDARVSTVFLGLNHSPTGTTPTIFETMVFGGALDGEMERYATWDEAEAGHRAMLERAANCD